MSNQIESIKKLYVYTKKYNIPKEKKGDEEQVVIEINPLSLDDMAMLDGNENMTSKEIAKNNKILFAKSLGIDEDEAGKISVEFMKDILDSIMNANNFDEEVVKKKNIKDFIDKKNAQIEEKKKDGESDKSA